ncbi:MAG TPA: dUTP diphosphatase [Chitinivibrionales bacterium]|jgi:dUTP pyrophosphatase|nr:dUTP diphosphatase [Chitinivibrionales bacterium]
MQRKKSTPRIIVQRLAHGAGLPVPARMTSGSSGCDVYAAIETDVVLEPSARALVPTGFCFEIPKGFEVQVRSRSGLAIKHGVFVLNSPGTIDADYRGEVKVILANAGSAPFTIKRGDRIGQLVVAPVANNIDFVESGNISETKRGAGGFGHTGV